MVIWGNNRDLLQIEDSVLFSVHDHRSETLVARIEYSEIFNICDSLLHIIRGSTRMFAGSSRQFCDFEIWFVCGAARLLFFAAFY